MKQLREFFNSQIMGILKDYGTDAGIFDIKMSRDLEKGDIYYKLSSGDEEELDTIEIIIKEVE